MKRDKFDTETPWDADFGIDEAFQWFSMVDATYSITDIIRCGERESNSEFNFGNHELPWCIFRDFHAPL